MGKIKSTKITPKAVGRFLLNNAIIELLIIMALVVGFTTENFFTNANFNNLAMNTSIRFLIALGVSGCLITKGTDLSAGRAAGLAACVGGVLMQDIDYVGRMFPGMPQMNMFIAFLIVVAITGVIGLINGLIISILKVPPFIATLGTQTAIYGTTLIFTNATPIGGFQESYTKFTSGALFNINGEKVLPYLMIIAVIFGVVFWVLYNKTTYGKNMYAIGGNENAAEVSGVNTVRSKILIYTVAGVMYGVAGFLLAGKSGGAASSLGMGYELEAIAGCTIGGVSTTGGIGRVGGVLIGVLVFEILKICLQFMNVNPYYNYIVQGLVIVLAVSLDIRKYLAKK